jgi:DNA gyrase subunit A
MHQNLHLLPERHHRKSAAVVGEVLARYHPHGDSACYDAMVRMAQDFSMRYPLVDGQGNFGSLDGDSAAAYRYTEAKLTEFALEVIGDIGQQTVAERDNFDQTVKEPVVLPARVPNLLVNGSSGIAVGMATAIPPHNLGEVIRALLLLIEDKEASTAKLLSCIKGPDFPTGCDVLNSRAELREIYETGRGAVRMRASYTVEEIKGRTKRKLIVINSVPYGVDKSSIVEKIADLIIARKTPQLHDVRDESTDEVRIVLEASPEADEDRAMAYLFKNTPLQQNFNVNLTALTPTANPYSGLPKQLSLREMLSYFLEFRVKVTRAKLEYEKFKLEERLHLLEGLALVVDVLEEVIAIVRGSDGRTDAAAKLRKRFKLSEAQAFFIVDLRIYQLSRTSVEEVEAELKEKRARVKEIDRILKSEKILREEVGKALTEVGSRYADSRRSKVLNDFEEPVIDTSEFIEHEDVFVVVTTDGWLKRIRTTNDPQATRLREGDSLFFVEEASTKDTLALLTSHGNAFGCSIYDVLATTGFGEPVQKIFKFQDGEQIVGCLILKKEAETNGHGVNEENAPVQASFGFAAAESPEKQKRGREASVCELLLFTKMGYGFRLAAEQLGSTKKTGKRLVRLSPEDRLIGFSAITEELLFLVSAEGYGTLFHASEVPQLSAGAKGVILQKLPGNDELKSARSTKKRGVIKVRVHGGKIKEVDISALTIGSRAKRGLKVIKRGGPVETIV